MANRKNKIIVLCEIAKEIFPSQEQIILKWSRLLLAGLRLLFVLQTQEPSQPREYCGDEIDTVFLACLKSFALAESDHTNSKFDSKKTFIASLVSLPRRAKIGLKLLYMKIMGNEKTPDYMNRAVLNVEHHRMINSLVAHIIIVS